MARPPKGKPLTLRPIRLDDDVWAECQRLGKEHGTINEGLRVRLLRFGGDVPATVEEVIERVKAQQEQSKWGPLDPKYEKPLARERAERKPLLKPSGRGKK